MVLKALNDVEGVEEAYAVCGVCDVVVKIKVESMEKLKEVVTRHVRRLTRQDPH